MKRKRNKWLLLYCLVLTAFTAYFLLDTFVITRVYSQEGVQNTAQQTISLTADNSTKENDKSQDEDESTKAPAGKKETTQKENSGKRSRPDRSSGKRSQSKSDSAENAITKNNSPAVTEDSYTDENIKIEISEYNVNDTTVYIADVQLKSAGYLKTALAQGLYGKNVTAKTSTIASGVNAILAINGDYYGAQEKGYVIRNGVLYRSTAAKGREDLVIYSDGSFGIINESQVSAEELLANGAQQVLSFGPALLTDGKIAVDSSDEVRRAMASNPRTAIGIVDELHYLFVVSDGRTTESEGLSVYELAQLMQELGAKTAYNLDGGGSSTMYFNGQVVNNPTSNGRTINERSVSDIVYIGY